MNAPLQQANRLVDETLRQMTQQIISVELTKDRYRELRLQQDDVVFVHPKQLHVFKMPGP